MILLIFRPGGATVANSISFNIEGRQHVAIAADWVL